MKEKSEFEKRTAEKQVSLLTEALTSAVDAKGHWLNASGKLYPKLYPKGFSVSPFNALVLALDDYLPELPMLHSPWPIKYSTTIISE